MKFTNFNSNEFMQSIPNCRCTTILLNSVLELWYSVAILAMALRRVRVLSRVRTFLSPNSYFDSATLNKCLPRNIEGIGNIDEKLLAANEKIEVLQLKSSPPHLINPRCRRDSGDFGIYGLRMYTVNTPETRFKGINCLTSLLTKNTLSFLNSTSNGSCSENKSEKSSFLTIVRTNCNKGDKHESY